MTLAELKTAMEDWAQTSETRFVAQENTMIQNAEKRIYNAVMVPDAKTTTTISATSGTNSYAKTIDMVMPLRMYITGSVPLLRKTASYIREVFVGYTNAQPTYYAWEKSTAAAATFLFGPTPNASYTVNLDYIDGTPPSLVTAETWLSTNFPDCLRKAAILEAAIFLKMWESVPILQADAEGAMAAAVQICGAPQKDEDWS